MVDLVVECKRVDIFVVVVGVLCLVKGDWIKLGVCVIDVGINCIDVFEKGFGKICLVGDVEFDLVF